MIDFELTIWSVSLLLGNTRKKNSGVVETEKEIIFEEYKIEAPVSSDVEPEYNADVKEEIKADPELENEKYCSPNVLNENRTDGADDNDDFEWEEEPPIGLINDSSENDGIMLRNKYTVKSYFVIWARCQS